MAAVERRAAWSQAEKAAAVRVVLDYYFDDLEQALPDGGLQVRQRAVTPRSITAAARGAPASLGILPRVRHRGAALRAGAAAGSKNIVLGKG